jgi:signal peptidase I
MEKKYGILLIIVGSSLLVSSVFFIDQLPYKYTDIVVAISGSMEPTINYLDTVRIDRQISIEEIYAANQYDDPPGDIFVYYGAREKIVHRVIDKKIVAGKTVFIFHGDANFPGANEEVSADRIIGKVVEINPLFWTYNLLFWIVLLLSGILFLILGIIVIA